MLARNNKRQTAQSDRSSLPYAPSPDYSPTSALQLLSANSRHPNNPLSAAANRVSQSFPESVGLGSHGSDGHDQRAAIKVEIESRNDGASSTSSVTLESSILPQSGVTNPFRDSILPPLPAKSTTDATKHLTPKGAKQTDSWIPTAPWPSLPAVPRQRLSPGGTTEIHASPIEEDPFAELDVELGGAGEGPQEVTMIGGGGSESGEEGRTGGLVASGYFAPQTGRSENFDPGSAGTRSAYSAPRTDLISTAPPSTGKSDPPSTGASRYPSSAPQSAKPSYISEPYTELSVPSHIGKGTGIPPLPSLPSEFEDKHVHLERARISKTPQTGQNEKLDPKSAGGETNWTHSSWAEPGGGLKAKHPDSEGSWYSDQYDIAGKRTTTGPDPNQMMSPTARDSAWHRVQAHEAFNGLENADPLPPTPELDEAHFQRSLGPTMISSNRGMMGSRPSQDQNQGRVYAHMSRAPTLNPPPMTPRPVSRTRSASLLQNGMLLWWRGYGIYANAACTTAACILLNLATRLTTSSISVVMSAPPSAFGASAASTTLSKINLALAGWCGAGSSNSTGAACTSYVGMDFQSSTGNIVIPDDILWTIADSLMNVLSPLSCLLALYTCTGAISQVMLLGATNLDLSFPSSSLTTEEIEQEIMHRSRRKDTDIVLWTWWAHTRSPLGHLFVVISMICCGVSVTCMLVLKSKIAGATIGIASIVPAIAIGLYLPMFVSAMSFFCRLPSRWRSFSMGPMERSDKSSKKAGKEQSRKVSRATRNAPPAMTMQTHQQNSKSNRRSKPAAKRNRRTHNLGRRPSSGSSFENHNSSQDPAVPGNFLYGQASAGEHPPGSRSPELQSPNVAPFTGAAFTPGTTRPSIRESGRERAPLESYCDGSIDAKARQSHLAHSILSEGPGEVRRWQTGYQESHSLLPIIHDLRAGDQVEPYVLSEDGLLYIYVEDEASEMDVAKLVPPDGAIRQEVLDEAYRDVLATNAAGVQNAGVALRLMMLELEKRYWWATMGEDVAKWLGL